MNLFRNVVSGIAFAYALATPGAAAPIMVQDFETDMAPSVWAVNMPDENASVQLSTDRPHDGKQCLRLHYRFVSAGDFQYLGIPFKAQLNGPIHKLRYWLKGDNSKCSYGLQLKDIHGKTHQFKISNQEPVIDFTGWRELVFDLDAPHETWGGDRDGKLDYPITVITLTVGQPMQGKQPVGAEGNLYFDSLAVESEKNIGETLGLRIAVLSPAYCSDIRGDTIVDVTAQEATSLTVKCWKQGDRFGTDSVVATVRLDEQRKGSFVFPADAYPHGPLTLRISGVTGITKDNCYLQLYNLGGVSWNEGMPEYPPPAARGMTLVFADDFSGPLSISSTNPKATYYDHKPPDGRQDFSSLRFTGFSEANNPFKQVDTYLRIRASEKTKSAGLISSIKMDASGVTAKIPCYFECRFIGPNAMGAWPAFWLMTDFMTDEIKGRKVPCDELDVIEAYGGEGSGSPNAFDKYMITPHCWDQGETGKALGKAAFKELKNPIQMGKFGIPSAWFETFHTYGCRITEAETIFYCDNIEVGRFATLPWSKQHPFFFMINLATGGGWPVDLSRYNGVADMYVDYVRVYQGSAPRTEERASPK
jgi:hypothetical protein